MSVEYANRQIGFGTGQCFICQGSYRYRCHAIRTGPAREADQRTVVEAARVGPARGKAAAGASVWQGRLGQTLKCAVLCSMVLVCASCTAREAEQPARPESTKAENSGPRISSRAAREMEAAWLELLRAHRAGARAPALQRLLDGHSPTVRLMRQALNIWPGTLGGDPDEWRFQLYARLLAVEERLGLEPFLARLRREGLGLVPLTPSLAQAGGPLHHILLVNDQAKCAAISHEADVLAIGYARGKLEFWQMDRTVPRRLAETRLRSGYGGATAIAATHAGTFLVGTSTGAVVRLRVTDDGRLLQTELMGPRQPKSWAGVPDVVAFISTANQAFALLTHGTYLEVRELNSRALITSHRFGADDSSSDPIVVASAWPARKGFIVGTMDGLLWFVGTESGTLKRLARLGARLWALAVSPDNTAAAAATADGRLTVWTLPTWRELCSRRLPSPALEISFLDNSRFVSGHWNGSLWLWDARRHAPVVKLRHAHVVGLLGGLLAWASGTNEKLVSWSGKEIRVWGWDAQSGPMRYPAEAPRHRSTIKAVDLAKRSDRLVTIGRDRRLKVWQSPLAQSPMREIDTSFSPTALALSPGGTVVAVCSPAGAVVVRGIDDAKQVRILYGHRGGVADLAFLDESTLAVASSNGTVRLWAIRERRCIRMVSTQPANTGSNRLAAARGLIALGASSGHVMVWDPYERESWQLLGKQPAAVTAICWADDGKYVVTGDLDGFVRVWPVQAGSRAFVLGRHRAMVTGLASVPGTDYVVSGSEDYSIQLWDVRRRVRVLRALVDFPVYGLAVGGTTPTIVARASSWLHVFRVGRPR